MRKLDKPHITFFASGAAHVSNRHTGVRGATAVVCADPTSASRVAYLMREALAKVSERA